jgi:hypothetical protein
MKSPTFESIRVQPLGAGMVANFSLPDGGVRNAAG